MKDHRMGSPAPEFGLAEQPRWPEGGCWTPFTSEARQPPPPLSAGRTIPKSRSSRQKRQIRPRNCDSAAIVPTAIPAVPGQPPPTPQSAFLGAIRKHQGQKSRQRMAAPRGEDLLYFRHDKHNRKSPKENCRMNKEPGFQIGRPPIRALLRERVHRISNGHSRREKVTPPCRLSESQMETRTGPMAANALASVLGL